MIVKKLINLCHLISRQRLEVLSVGSTLTLSNIIKEGRDTTALYNFLVYTFRGLCQKVANFQGNLPEGYQAMTSQRTQVIQLYKTLLYLGRDYPQGYDFFRTRLKRAFFKNKNVDDPEKLQVMIKHGEYVVKELEALYMLRKYRTLKRRYYNEPIPEHLKPEALENMS